MSWITPFGAGAGADALMAIQKQQANEDYRRQMLAQEQQKINIDRQRAQGDITYKDALIAAMNGDRDAQTALRTQETADLVANNLPRGSMLDPKAVAALRAGNYGSRIQHQEATPTGIASTVNVGGLPMPILNPGNPAGDLWMGTAKQVQADADRAARTTAVAGLPANSPLRLWTAYNGANPADRPPAELFADPNAKFDEFKRQWDYEVAHPKPLADGDSITRLRGRLMMDDPSFPRGVQDYVTSLRAKYPTFDAAQQEFSSALPSLRSAHPSLQSDKAMNALRGAYGGGGKPPGLIDELLSGSDQPNGTISFASPPVGGPQRPVSLNGGTLQYAGRGSAPTRIVGVIGPNGTMSRVAGAGSPGGTPTRTVTTSELAAIAAKRGTSVEQERQRATAAGFVVR